MSAWDVYYKDDEEGTREFVESFSDPHDAYVLRDKLQTEVDEDDDSPAIRVIVIEEA